MKQVSGKELARIITGRGWVLKRIVGSHHVFAKEGVQERIVIPIHGNKPIKIGLLLRQMKIAELTREDL